MTEKHIDAPNSIGQIYKLILSESRDKIALPIDLLLSFDFVLNDITHPSFSAMIVFSVQSHQI